MSDPIAPDRAVALTLPPAGEFLSLFRWVEGWIDGDLLLAEEGSALLAEIAAAGQARDAGDPAAAGRHIGQFLRALESLIASRRLEAADGSPALAAARKILDHPAPFPGEIPLSGKGYNPGSAGFLADWREKGASPMAKFMSSHTMPAGAMKREQVSQMAQAAQNDATVRPYRSFLNLSEGKVLCIMEAPSQSALADWFEKMHMPCDYITPVELEGERGEVMEA